MTSVFQKSNHQRQSSQAQQLIQKDTANNYDHSFEESATPYSDVVECSASSSKPVLQHLQQQQKNNVDSGHKSSTNTDSMTNAMRFSTLSDCSSYYGLPGSHTENETRYLGKNPYLRANIRVVIGSVVLTLVGLSLLVFGLSVMLIPNEMDIHGWIFLVVGFLFFIPGVYHVTFILCALSGRPGYSFENLPTFSKP